MNKLFPPPYRTIVQCPGKCANVEEQCIWCGVWIWNYKEVLFHCNKIQTGQFAMLIGTTVIGLLAVSVT